MKKRRRQKMKKIEEDRRQKKKKEEEDRRRRRRRRKSLTCAHAAGSSPWAVGYVIWLAGLAITLARQILVVIQWARNALP